jgi:acetyl-CoA acetyltransferase
MGFDGVVIAGAAETPYARRLAGGSTLGLFKDVFLRAIESAGVAHRDVDGIAVASFTLKPDHAVDVAWQLGLTPRWLMEDTNGGASGINMLQHAARAIQAGDAHTIVILAADHFQAGDFKHLVENYNRTSRDHLAPLGFGGPNALFALVTQSHARAHGLGRADYGAVCIAQRNWARRNPQAVYRSELTMAEYLAAPMIADPLCRFDCVPVVCGADAIVLTASGRAGISHHIGIRALAARYNPDHQEAAGWRTGLGDVSAALWNDASAGPDDMSLLSVYDDYPVMVLAQLADFGCMPDGDLARFIHERLPRLAVNTSGGQLSAGQAGAAAGLHGLVEAVVQLSGEAGERQIAGARLAAVAGYGMVQYRYGMCANAVVLERLSAT